MDATSLLCIADVRLCYRQAQLHRLTFSTRYSSEPRVDLDEVEEEEERLKKESLKGIDNPAATYMEEKQTPASPVKGLPDDKGSEMQIEELPAGLYLLSVVVFFLPSLNCYHPIDFFFNS
jgi:hypothetical protein